MPKALTLGNGNILVNFDEHACVKDLYYPFIGQENQVGEYLTHRVGVWVDGELSWFESGDWQIIIGSDNEALAGNTTALNNRLGISLVITDVVYNEKNILVRKLAVKNTSDRRRSIKLYFGQQFAPYEARGAHTAFYDPISKIIIHYRNRRAFAVNAQLEGRGFDDFTTGVFGQNGLVGSHLDALDGRLSQNPIEHGQADSVIGLTEEYDPQEEKFVYYWLAIGASVEEVKELNTYVLSTGGSHIIKTTKDFWHAWINRQKFSFYGLDEEIISLFKKSLFIIRAHVDHAGGIIASGDSSMLQQGKDSYAYVWPRDGAYAAMALDCAGDWHVTQRFFRFCEQTISAEGYFLHKFSPDGSLGSSWHGWLRDGKIELPIQEDETAVVISALGQHYYLSKDLEFIEYIYNNLIKKAADFMIVYRDEQTGLPHSSFDLWEERFGVHTYTAASIYGALVAAARLAEMLGKVKSAHRYLDTALAIKQAILKYLFDEADGTFCKSLIITHDSMVKDKTIDVSSVFSIFNFGVLSAADERVRRAMSRVEQTLLVKTEIGGLARYQNDNYFRSDSSSVGNPWLVTTLWLAQYYIAIARNDQELEPARNWLRWVVKRAAHSGILPEQINPATGERLSAAPLVWSHAEFVTTIIKYLDKCEELGLCQTCNPVY